MSAAEAMKAGVEAVSAWAIPVLVAGVIGYGWWRGVRVYEEFVEGAKEGFQTFVRILPYLVAMLAAIGMFRAAGGIALLSGWLGPVLAAVGFPVEVLPLALMRPLSGSASTGIFTELVKAHGPDSLIGRTAGTMMGCTETTFYVLAVYFGAVGVRNTRHAIPVGLVADVAGIAAAVYIVALVY